MTILKEWRITANMKTGPSKERSSLTETEKQTAEKSNNLLLRIKQSRCKLMTAMPMQ